MKIAIVGPSPVPFTIGGAENLMWSLCEAINQETEHQAELIKLPSRELGFWELIQTYYDFYKLNLDHFDLVISTKYPSWMVQHRNCVCYMVHTLRGLYDTYHLMNLPDYVDENNRYVNQVLEFMEERRDVKDLDDFFELIFSLKGIDDIPQSYFSFPGPFIRLIIHYLDHTSMKQPGMKKICAISNTVKLRTEYYPQGAKVIVAYPPTNMKKRGTGEMKHIFIASRLDAPKRIDMLIRAMKYVEGNVQLYIAGSGPQRNEWEKLAKKDKRIHFLGFVDDETLEEYYANSIVIPYFPYDEDYGYITIEAMLHKKPVITTNDAGGPIEFVMNGETGYVTKFDERVIADKINYLVSHKEEAKEMGEKAYLAVKDISWKKVIEKLIAEVGNKGIEMSKENPVRETKKITVISTFSVYPPMGGGQARSYSIYKNLAKNYDVNLVSFVNADKKESCEYIAPNFREICIPKSSKHQELEWKLESKAQIPISDIGMITLWEHSPEYVNCLKQTIEESDIVIISHPYLYYAIKNMLNGKVFIYEAQDVEYKIKNEMLPNTSIKKKLLEDIYKIEKEVCEKSNLIMTCSKEDQILLNEIYDVSLSKIIEVPNGVDCDNVKFTSVSERLENKKKLKLDNEVMGIFMGSWHQPNLEACKKIMEIAPKCPHVKFLLIGSQCEYFKNRVLPANVGLMGLLSEAEKALVFETVDFALNPMMSGSGTNLKMFDYMASGIPVITTEFGTRGIERKDIFLISEIEQMYEKINDFQLLEMSNMVKSARKYVKKSFDWENISRILINVIEQGVSSYKNERDENIDMWHK